MFKNYKDYSFIFIFCFFFFGASSLIAQEMSIFDIARKGSLTELKMKFSKDADIINTKSKEGYTPLTLACYYSNNEVAKYLIENVKDVNAKGDFGTPLMASVVKNNIELVSLLLNKKVDPDITDANGTTALHYAVMFGFEEISELLIKANAKSSIKDNRGNSALDYANITKNEKIIKLLKSN